MFGITGKIAIVELILLLLAIIGGYLYYHFTQATILTLTVNAAQLQTAVDTQKATIQAQIDAAQEQDSAMLVLQRSSDASENARRDLEDKLQKHDLDALARSKSAELELIINQATVKAFSDIEHLTDPAVTKTPTITATPNVIQVPK